MVGSVVVGRVVVVVGVDSGVVLVVAVVVVEGVVVEGILPGMITGVAVGVAVTRMVAGSSLSVAIDVIADVRAPGETLVAVVEGEIVADETPGVATGVTAVCVFAPATEVLLVRVTEVSG